MSIIRYARLINKIDTYIDDKVASGENLPQGRLGMKAAAIINYCIYGTSFSEYFAYRFYALSHSEKQTFMTRRHMFRFFDKYNPKSLRVRIGDKRETKKYYGNLMQRDQFDYKEGYEGFCEFAQLHPIIFVKRAISWGGEGAYKADISTEEKRLAEWKKLDENCVIEECVENCREIRALYAGALNTIKVVTLWINDKPEIQSALFRMGNNTVVDNAHSGGLYALVDIETGCVITKALDNHFREYVMHPVTSEQIVGFRIPQWEDVKQVALSAASVTPGMKYSSWDIAVTDKGPIVIEGNWDAEFYAEQTLMQRGLRKKYSEKLRNI